MSDQSQLATIQKVPRIAITGTKGKTTVTTILSQVFQALKYNVLSVDTTGHFLNGERKSTLKDSQHIWGLVPSVAPGRYLYEFLLHPELISNGIAILESSLGSSTLSGISYGRHNIGVFLNVFEDHIGNSSRISSKDDIVDAKSFIFSRIGLDGAAIYNADDPFVVSALNRVPKHVNAVHVPFGLTLSEIDTTIHLENGGVYITVDDGEVIMVSRTGKKCIVRLTDVVWTFGGDFIPSVYNLLAVVATCVGHFGSDTIPDTLGEILAKTRLDQYGGRLTLLQDNKGVTVLADYAHEKYSLMQVASLAKTLTSDGGNVIGVIRLAYDRTEELITETGKYIANAFDRFIVYDKIDGYWRHPAERLQSDRFTQQVGYVSGLLSKAIQEKNDLCEVVLREDEALARAYEYAKPGDVIVFIVNDDITRSINFVTDICNADFV